MCEMELIELQDLAPVNSIELTAPVGPRSLSGAQVIQWQGDQVSPEGTGMGHTFLPYTFSQPTWCDLCGDFIWGLYKQSLRCSNCRFTCHHRCRPFIQLDCVSAADHLPEQCVLEEGSVEMDTNVDEQDELREWEARELVPSEIQQKVKEYNALVNNNHFIVLNRDGTFTGFIRVHFRLKCPVSVPTTLHEAALPRRRTSFFLPQDAVQHVHISSTTDARQVIEALLSKCALTDHPSKFALFQHHERHGQVYLQKLSGEERPLLLRLCAGPCEKTLSLVLKENEAAEVNWEAFSLPELRNFLSILKREEEEYVRQIVERYTHAGEHLKRALAKW